MAVRVVVAGNTREETEAWRCRFARVVPGIEFMAWGDDDTGPDADYAIVWKPPREFFPRQPGLKAVFNLGAGVDSLMAMPGLPPDLPVVRLEDAGMARQMVQYVLHGLAEVSRGFDQYAAHQRAGRWAPLEGIAYHEWPVGVMGLGMLGSEVAQAIAQAGYPVAGWSRSQRQIAGVDTFSGEEGLEQLLARTRVLVNILPLTPDTENLLNHRNLAKLLPGAYVINVARGAHVVDEDLLALIDAGHLQGALLDVFRHEPLPADHPYWRHPRVRVTPHVAAATLEDETVKQIAQKIQALERGQAITGVVARGRGY